MADRKTKRMIIFGIGFFADQIFRYLSVEGVQVAAFTVEKEFCNVNTFHDLPVVPFEEIKNEFPEINYSILVCIGYNNMNQVREKIFKRIKEAGYDIASYIHPKATILADSLGEGNIVLENANIGIGCRIGDGNIFYNNTVISHDTTIRDFNYFSPSATVLGKVNIHNGCFFGGNSTIKDSITIGDYCLVGANAFVKRDINNYEVVVPAESVVLDCDSMTLARKLM